MRRRCRSSSADAARLIGITRGRPLGALRAAAQLVVSGSFPRRSCAGQPRRRVSRLATACPLGASGRSRPIVRRAFGREGQRVLHLHPPPIRSPGTEGASPPATGGSRQGGGGCGHGSALAGWRQRREGSRAAQAALAWGGPVARARRAVSASRRASPTRRRTVSRAWRTTLPRLFKSTKRNLDLAGKAVAAGPHHGPPQLVQPGPGGLVAAEAEGTLQPQGAHPVLLAGHEPHRQEPCPQRLAGLRYRAGGYRGLPAACPAPQPATGHFPRLADNPTVWAAKTGRPAEPADIGAASNLIPKPLVQCLEGAWVVDARHRMPHGPHPSTISVAAGGMKGIPTYWNSATIGVLVPS